MQTIVVGVDGSDGATAALKFAAQEAALRNARLRIVSAWELPLVAYASGFAPLDWHTLDPIHTRAQQVADDALSTAKKLKPSLQGEARVIEGQPAEVLLGQAADAELLVVGSRGHGGFKTLLLGSVSQQILHHANRPVVVVHRPAKP